EVIDIARMDVKTTILFNMVIHPGNVDYFDSLLDMVTACVPGSLANPYPAQSFKGGPPCWTLESLPALRTHILHLIDRTLKGLPGVTKRIHYYIALEAAFRAWYGKDNERLIRFMSGIDAWDCTLRPGAYRYAQIGKGPTISDGSPDTFPVPGGHIGCYWRPEW